jgi:hypothetical protein
MGNSLFIHNLLLNPRMLGVERNLLPCPHTITWSLLAGPGGSRGSQSFTYTFEGQSLALTPSHGLSSQAQEDPGVLSHSLTVFYCFGWNRTSLYLNPPPLLEKYDSR